MQVKKIEDLEVIVCDDSKLARRLLEKSLKELGVTNVRQCAGGEEALNQYKEKKADIVFLDLVMPKKSGKETLKELMVYDKKAVVIVVSSAGTSSNLKEVLVDGAKDFIQKPLDDNSLKAVIDRILEEGV